MRNKENTGGPGEGGRRDGKARGGEQKWRKERLGCSEGGEENWRDELRDGLMDKTYCTERGGGGELRDEDVYQSQWLAGSRRGL